MAPDNAPPTNEQMLAHVRSIQEAGRQVQANLLGASTGATPAQLAAQEPRPAAELDEFCAGHTAAAKESSHAEAMYLANAALGILTTIAARSATGGIAG